MGGGYSHNAPIDISEDREGEETTTSLCDSNSILPAGVEDNPESEGHFCGYCSKCFEAHRIDHVAIIYATKCGGECNKCKKKHIVYYQWDAIEKKAFIVTPPVKMQKFGEAGGSLVLSTESSQQ
jgi:hypothetical protein